MSLAGDGIVPAVAMVDYVAADEPTGGAAHEDVGGEVLLSHESGEADAGGPGVDHDAGPGVGVFTGNAGCGGPGEHGMGRRERGVC